MKYFIPLLFIAIMSCAALKRVNVFKAFSRGAADAEKFILSLLPVLICTFIMCELFERSRLSDLICSALSPLLNTLGVPQGLEKLIVIKPFSGSGSLAYLTDILSEYGADSYTGRCACVLYGSSETTFYISAIYFADSRQKKRLVPTAIILFATGVATVLACLICRVI